MKVMIMMMTTMMVIQEIVAGQLVLAWAAAVGAWFVVGCLAGIYRHLMLWFMI